MKSVVIIGAGFGGLSAACYLAKAGYGVTVLEKNKQVGGRAMTMKKDGFMFDLGPSWYMMPDVFEEFFSDFNKKPSDYYQLIKLDPSYKIFTKESSHDVFGYPKIKELFEKLEPGSSTRLQELLSKTSREYSLVRESILNYSMLKPSEFMNKKVLKMMASPEVLGSYHNRISKYIKHPDLQKILEFMVVFMGGSPKNIPAPYTLLTHVDINLGIWYPKGGMNKLAESMYILASELGVEFVLDTEVTSIKPSNSKKTKVKTNNGSYECEIVVANADYHHVESNLLGKESINWNKKVISPSGLLIYLGINRKLQNIRHHNLFFDTDWDNHFHQVFDSHTWSDEPMFYIGAPSVSDDSVAPKGMENMFILAPMANGAQPSKYIIDKTVNSIIERIEIAIGEKFSDDIIVKEVRAQNYFKNTFNAYKGNAFGLAHTLSQSAFLRPPIRHKVHKNLFFVGQYTNPGTGVPIVTLSGKVVATEIIKTQGHAR